MKRGEGNQERAGARDRESFGFLKIERVDEVEKSGEREGDHLGESDDRGRSLPLSSETRGTPPLASLVVGSTLHSPEDSGEAGASQKG